MATFTVTGEKRHSDAILKADILRFNSNARLVLAPTEQGKGGPTANTLVIIGGVIDIADHATIIWDLDGLPGDPLSLYTTRTHPLHPR